MHHAVDPPSLPSHLIRSLRAAFLLCAAAILPACGGSISTSSGYAAGNHPVTPPDQLQILIKPPAQYERLGTVTHLYTDGLWQQGADATPIFQDLLTESSAMGANVLLLADDTTMADTSITMKYQGNNFTLPVIAKSKTVLAQAIFVPKQ